MVSNGRSSGNSRSGGNRGGGSRSGGGRSGGGRSGKPQSAGKRSGGPRRRPESRPRPAARTQPGDAGARPATATRALALSTWDLARTRKARPDSPRGHIINLRAHQKLVDSFESERTVPENDRSFLRVQEGARGSCLLIHGVSTGPGDLKDLARVLFDAGLNVYVLRLPDHGTGDSTLSEVSWGSSLRQARQCFQLLAKGGGAVHVVGLGFGAALALHLADKESVTSLILMAPAIMPRESVFQRFLVRMKLHHLEFVHRWLGWNADLIEGMDRARGKISKIRVPIYAAQCEDDDRASSGSLRILQGKARHSGSRFRLFPTGGHQILEVHGEETLFEDIVDFCRID